MNKLVVLKLDGDLHLGVQATLEIGEEGKRPTTEITGKLPSNLDMAIAIDQWQSTYRSLGKFTRIKGRCCVNRQNGKFYLSPMFARCLTQR